MDDSWLPLDGAAMTAPRNLFMALASTNILLALVLAYALAAPVWEPDPPFMTMKTRSAQEAAALPVIVPPADAFSDIAQRPLFSPSRTGIASDAAAQAALPPDIQLVGVIADAEQRIALVRVPGEPLAKALQVGGVVSGWRVADIQADRVVLEGAGGRVEFRLNANAAPKQPGPSPTSQ